MRFDLRPEDVGKRIQTAFDAIAGKLRVQLHDEKLPSHIGHKVVGFDTGGLERTSEQPDGTLLDNRRCLQVRDVDGDELLRPVRSGKRRIECERPDNAVIENVALKKGEAGLPKRSVVNISQVFTVDKTALVKRLGALSPRRMMEVIAEIRLLTEPLDPGGAVADATP